MDQGFKALNSTQTGQSGIVSEGSMSGQVDCSHAFITDLSNQNVRAMIVFHFRGGDSYQECFPSLTIYLGKSILQNPL